MTIDRKTYGRIVAVVCAVFWTCTSAQAQTVDGFDPGSNGKVDAMAVQPDGKIVVGGTFSLVGGGGTGVTPRARIARLNVDGSVDASFDPGVVGSVLGVAVQTDGKILVVGAFTVVAGVTRNNIARLNPDGSLDVAFNPGSGGGGAFGPEVDALAIQADGKILVGGEFTTLGGGTGTTTRNRIGRLNADGTVDLTFSPAANEAVISLAVQPDGRIVVGGVFTTLAGAVRNKIARLNANGTIDTSFNPGTNVTAGTVVTAVALQADGKILVGGNFTGLGGTTGTTPRNRIGRLNADGSVDAAFNPGVTGSIVYSIVVQADGKILVGGNFTALGDGGTTPRRNIGRLGADGSPDASFDPGANATVEGLLVQPDGSILLGGLFTGLGGGTGTTLRSRIGRITNTDAAVQSLSLTSGRSLVTWLRSGAAPEVSRVTFDWSTNGLTYSPLGSGTRVAGGWQLAGLSLPNQNLYIRARGYYVTGYENASGSIAETIVNMPRTDSRGDFDGDGRSEIAVFRPSTGQWFVLRSSTNFTGGALYQWGGSGDIPVPADYDDDGRPDIAVYRPSTGQWFVLRSSTSYTGGAIYQWGGDASDIPVPGDYDGDSRPDIAVYRKSTGQWFVLRSSTNYTGGALYGWGGDASDSPVVGDYDGDGRADITVYRRSTGQWFVLRSSTSFTGGALYTWGGSAGDVPVPGDYDGDAITDIAVYRPAQGNWYILRSSTNFTGGALYQWGESTDRPVPADYDGDGKTDIAIFRPAQGNWYVLRSSTNFTGGAVYQWGGATDVPASNQIAAQCAAVPGSCGP